MHERVKQYALHVTHNEDATHISSETRIWSVIWEWIRANSELWLTEEEDGHFQKYAERN